MEVNISVILKLSTVLLHKTENFINEQYFNCQYI